MLALEHHCIRTQFCLPLMYHNCLCRSAGAFETQDNRRTGDFLLPARHPGRLNPPVHEALEHLHSRAATAGGAGVRGRSTHQIRSFLCSGVPFAAPATSASLAVDLLAERDTEGR